MNGRHAEESVSTVPVPMQEIQKPGYTLVIPAGTCHCGCSRPVREGNKFLRGHHRRKHRMPVRINPDSGCWEWMWAKTSNGYGLYRRPGAAVPEPAHRVLYKKHKGEIPAGMDIHHLCGNRGCVNPLHLEAVTRPENIRRSATAKLDWEAVREIRSSSEPNTHLAAHFGVLEAAIINVRKGRTWKEETWS